MPEIKHRKPRTGLGRRTNQKLQESGTECEWYGGGYPECSLPWTDRCNGNPFICKKCWYQHLASAKKPNRQAVIDFEQRERLCQKSNIKRKREVC